jgi:hypothetical protein
VDDVRLYVALALATIGVGSTEGELAVACHLFLAYCTVWGDAISSVGTHAALSVAAARLRELQAFLNGHCEYYGAIGVVAAGGRAWRLRQGRAWRLRRSEWFAWADASGME